MGDSEDHIKTIEKEKGEEEKLLFDSSWKEKKNEISHNAIQNKRKKG